MLAQKARSPALEEELTMSNEGMAAMRATTGDVSALVRLLDDSEWTAPSAAAG